MTSSNSPEDEAAINTVVARLARIDTTAEDEILRFEGRLILEHEGPAWVYVEAVRRYEAAP